MARRKLKSSDPKLLERVVIAAMVIAIGAAVYFNYLAARVEATSTKQGEFDVLRGARLVAARRQRR